MGGKPRNNITIMPLTYHSAIDECWGVGGVDCLFLDPLTVLEHFSCSSQPMILIFVVVFTLILIFIGSSCCCSPLSILTIFQGLVQLKRFDD